MPRTFSLRTQIHHTGHDARIVKVVRKFIFGALVTFYGAAVLDIVVELHVVVVPGRVSILRLLFAAEAYAQRELVT